MTGAGCAPQMLKRVTPSACGHRAVGSPFVARIVLFQAPCCVNDGEQLNSSLAVVILPSAVFPHSFTAIPYISPFYRCPSFCQTSYLRSRNPNEQKRFVFPSVGSRAPFPFLQNTNPQTPAVKLQSRALTFGFGSILHAQMGLHKVQSSEECCKLSSQVKLKKLKGEEKEPKPREVKKEAPRAGRMGSDSVPMFPQGKR